MHYERKPGEDLIPKTLTMDALCIWEQILLLRQRVDHAHVEHLWSNVGAWAMRELSLELAPYAENLWSESTQDGEISWEFDWEFVPGFINLIMDLELVEFDNNIGGLTLSGLDERWHEIERWALQKITEKRAA